MSYSSQLYDDLRDMGLHDWLVPLQALLAQRLSPAGHGDFTRWQTALLQLPAIQPGDIRIDQDTIQIGRAGELNAEQTQELHGLLLQLHPWRKGPFELFGIHIDTEWRSDWKWQRLAPHLADLQGRRVLDVGCGSGYHAWRMRGAGARMVLGVDPTLLFVMQFLAIQHFVQDHAVNVLPLGIDELPHEAGFDTVFSMGLLYHQRDAIAHLHRLAGLLRDGGELVMETLVVDEAFAPQLIPEGRYAQMRNVWSIPTVTTLQDWMRQAGLQHVRCVDVNQTSTQEQRSTEWMKFQSLKDFLDPSDQNKTIEGYPAPRRAIVLAEK